MGFRDTCVPVIPRMVMSFLVMMGVVANQCLGNPRLNKLVFRKTSRYLYAARDPGWMPC